MGIEDFVPSETLKLIKLVTSEFVEKSRDVPESNNVFDIGPGHSYENPVLRRLKSPDENHQEYWNFSKDLIADVASDLVGPTVTFHHSKLNFKWYDKSDTVKWHKDIQCFPHTKYNVLIIRFYL